MRTLSRARVGLGMVLCALVVSADAQALEFVPGHYYATRAQTVTQYDAAGDFVAILNLTGQFPAPNREFRGLAFGPDGLLYVAQVRDPGNGFRVIALDAAGTVHGVLSDPAAIWNNLGFGKLAFDEAGLLYVGTNSGLVRFDPESPGTSELIYDLGRVFDVEPLPGRGFLVYGPGLREIDTEGAEVRSIQVTDPDGLAGGGLFFLSSPRGLEYDPGADEIFLSMGGFTGQQDRLMRTDADGVLLAITTFTNPLDLYWSGDHLVVGSRTFSPGLFDRDLEQLRTLGPDPFDRRLFVTRLDEPAQLTIGIEVEPGRRQAHVNPLGHRPVPVALFGSDGFDVDAIDVSSVAFGPFGAAPLPLERRSDVDADGTVDLVLRFDMGATGIAAGDVEACLTGQASDGSEFEGCAAIRTRPR